MSRGGREQRQQFCLAKVDPINLKIVDLRKGGANVLVKNLGQKKRVQEAGKMLPGKMA